MGDGTPESRGGAGGSGKTLGLEPGVEALGEVKPGVLGEEMLGGLVVGLGGGDLVAVAAEAAGFGVHPARQSAAWPSHCTVLGWSTQSAVSLRSEEP